MRTVCDRCVLVPMLAGVLLTSAGARGDDFEWVGDGGITFHDPSNWSSFGGGAPGAEDRGIFALDDVINVWLNFQPDQDRVGQVRVEAGTVNLRVFTVGDHFQMLGGSLLQPALQVVAADDAVTTLSIGTIGTTVARTVEIGEIVLGEVDGGTGGTVVFDSPAQQSQLTLDVARGVTIGLGATDAAMTLRNNRRLTTTDLTIAAGDPVATGALELIAAETFVTGLLRVGALGTGQATVQSGGRLECRELQLGGFIGAAGELLVTGAESEIRVESFCDIGYGGIGDVVVSEAGQFTALETVFVGFLSTVMPDGTVIPSAGRVAVDGPGAEFLALEDLWLGFAGEGSVRSTRSGRVSIHGALRSTNATGTHVEVILEAPDGGGPIVDVDDDVAALRYAIGLEPSASFDGSETWTLIRSGSTLAAPLEILTDDGDGAWRPVATVMNDRITVALVPRADLDGSGAVDFGDLLVVLGAWGLCPEPRCPADLDGSGAVDFDDLLIVLANWSQG